MNFSNLPSVLFLLASMAVSTAAEAKISAAGEKNNPPAGMQIVCPGDQTFAANGSASCTATVTLPNAQVIGNTCPGATTVSFSSEIGVGTGPFWNVPVGKWSVHVKALNPCGEEATCQFNVIVKDAKKPAANIVKDLYANLASDGTTAFRARTFDLGSTDNCSQKAALRFAFSQNPADSVRLFDCDSVGLRTVNIYVIDESGNAAVKPSLVHICDALGACQLLFASGKITTEAGVPVQNVEVEITKGSEFSTIETGETGSFKFQKIQPGMTVQIAPKKDLNPTNGVSTIDLALISRHILGQKPLGSPLKIIAADVNRNGYVTTADLVELRKLILGEITDFTQNDSWRFVPKSFVFQDPAQPLAQQIPEAETFASLTNSQSSLDFFGIKIGDVSGDAIANNLGQTGSEDRSNGELFLKTTDRDIRTGEQVEVAFEADLAQIDGLQTTLNFDPNQLVFNGLGENGAAGFSEKNIGTGRLADGKLPISWFSENEKPAGQTALFTLKFRAAAAGRLSEMLRLGDLPTTTTAFDGDGLTYNLKLKFEDRQAQAPSAAPSLSLEQNEPNPASGATRVRFSQPADGPATLRIFDAMGREAWHQTGDFAAGANAFSFDAAALGLPTGRYFYRLETASGSLARKLDLIFR